MFLTRKYKSLIKENNKLLRENNRLLLLLQERIKIMEVPLDYKQYWVSDNMSNIIPLNQGTFPEGFDPGKVIYDLLKDYNPRKILDFGCGYGRLSPAFPSNLYIGIDLNPEAIRVAQKNNPDKEYHEINVDSEYPKCDAAFAHTVFLHNDNKTMQSILGRLEKTGVKYIVISDIISKDWHNGFIPPTFFRDIEDYNNLLNAIGFTFVSETRRVYKRYAESEQFNHLNTDLSFLLYSRK